MVIEITVFHGYGFISQGVLANIKSVVERLRDFGLTVALEEVTVPVLDEEFEPYVLINGIEVHVPFVDVDRDILSEYILDTLLRYSLMMGFPTPPAILGEEID